MPIRKQVIPRILRHGKTDRIAGLANRRDNHKDMALCRAARARAGSRRLRLENANRDAHVSVRFVDVPRWNNGEVRPGVSGRSCSA
jgi:hypothetical protein